MTQAHQSLRRSTLFMLVLLFMLALVSPGLGFATDLPIYGGLGGNEFPPAQCPQGWYLVGLAGQTGSWVDRIAPICAPWLRGSQAFGTPTIGQSFGMSRGGKERQASCIGDGTNNRAIQSWWIRLLRSDDHYVQSIEMYCDSLPTPFPPTNWRPRLDFGTFSLPPDADEMVTGGPFGSQPPFQACPAGEVAVGFRVRAGQFVDAVGLICGPRPPSLGAAVTKPLGPLVQAPSPATPINPRAKNIRVPNDMFVITRPAPGDRVPQGQLIVNATPPKVGATNVTELELRYLDAPPTQRDSYPYVTVFSVDTAKLLQGYPVAQIVTGGYGGRWQVRARSSMKAVPGPWSIPVQFQLVTASQQQLSPVQTSPLPQSSILKAPQQPAGTGTMGTPQTAPSQASGGFSGMIRRRGVDEKGSQEGSQNVDQPAEMEKKP